MYGLDHPGFIFMPIISSRNHLMMPIVFSLDIGL